MHLAEQLAQRAAPHRQDRLERLRRARHQRQPPPPVRRELAQRAQHLVGRRARQRGHVGGGAQLLQQLQLGDVRVRARRADVRLRARRHQQRRERAARRRAARLDGARVATVQRVQRTREVRLELRLATTRAAVGGCGCGCGRRRRRRLRLRGRVAARGEGGGSGGNAAIDHAVAPLQLHVVPTAEPPRRLQRARLQRQPRRVAARVALAQRALGAVLHLAEEAEVAQAAAQPELEPQQRRLLGLLGAGGRGRCGRRGRRCPRRRLLPLQLLLLEHLVAAEGRRVAAVPLVLERLLLERLVAHLAHQPVGLVGAPVRRVQRRRHLRRELARLDAGADDVPRLVGALAVGELLGVQQRAARRAAAQRRRHELRARRRVEQLVDGGGGRRRGAALLVLHAPLGHHVEHLEDRLRAQQLLPQRRVADAVARQPDAAADGAAARRLVGDAGRGKGTEDGVELAAPLRDQRRLVAVGHQEQLQHVRQQAARQPEVVPQARLARQQQLRARGAAREAAGRARRRRVLQQLVAPAREPAAVAEADAEDGRRLRLGGPRLGRQLGRERQVRLDGLLRLLGEARPQPHALLVLGAQLAPLGVVAAAALQHVAVVLPRAHVPRRRRRAVAHALQEHHQRVRRRLHLGALARALQRAHEEALDDARAQLDLGQLRRELGGAGAALLARRLRAAVAGAAGQEVGVVEEALLHDDEPRRVDGAQLAQALRREVDGARVLRQQRARRVGDAGALARAQQRVEELGGRLAVLLVRREQRAVQLGRRRRAQVAEQLLHRHQPHGAALVREQPRAAAQLPLEREVGRVAAQLGVHAHERRVVGQEADLAERARQRVRPLAVGLLAADDRLEDRDDLLGVRAQARQQHQHELLQAVRELLGVDLLHERVHHAQRRHAVRLLLEQRLERRDELGPPRRVERAAVLDEAQHLVDGAHRRRALARQPAACLLAQKLHQHEEVLLDEAAQHRVGLVDALREPLRAEHPRRHLARVALHLGVVGDERDRHRDERVERAQHVAERRAALVGRGAEAEHELLHQLAAVDLDHLGQRQLLERLVGHLIHERDAVLDRRAVVVVARGHLAVRHEELDQDQVHVVEEQLRRAALEHARQLRQHRARRGAAGGRAHRPARRGTAR